MKVLILTHLDATNYSIATIVKELIKRGHYVEGYGRFTDSHNVRMFNDLLDIHAMSELTDEHIEEFDIIFAALDVIARVRHIKKYIFCYNFLFCGNLIADCGDFMFTQCEERNLDYIEECASMAIGNPKVTKMPCIQESEKKQFLFIDSGHYPFGVEGKEALANLLISIAKQYPEYTLKIKPRFLPGDTNVTHENNCHLYDVLARRSNNNIPSNIYMLQEHLDMNTLIRESCLVLCLYTTAYVDAILLNKRLIIIDGLPNDDSYDLRNKFHWRKQREVMQKSGCMCHYKEVLQHMPGGFICRPEHIEEVVKYTDNVPERAVDVMEQVWDKYISAGKFPALESHNCENYCITDIGDETLDWEKMLVKRYKNALRYSSRFIDYVDVDIVKKQYMDMINDYEDKGLISSSTYDAIQKILVYYRNKTWIDHKELLWNDAINQSFYLWALYENHCYKELKEMDEKLLCCKGQYYHIRGRVAYDENKYEEAIRYLKDYLKDSRARGYSKFITDRADRQVSGEFFIGMSYYRLGDLNEAYNQFMVCKELTGNNHRKAQEYIDIIKKRLEL